MKKIIICPTCKGVGKLHIRRDVGTHKSEYEYEDKKCKECKGSGRLYQEVCISTEPFNPKNYTIEYI